MPIRTCSIFLKKIGPVGLLPSVTVMDFKVGSKTTCKYMKSSSTMTLSAEMEALNVQAIPFGSANNCKNLPIYKILNISNSVPHLPLKLFIGDRMSL